MQLNGLREASKRIGMDALDFICCQVEDNQILQVPQKLLADVSYEIFLQMKALEVDQVVKGISCNLI